MPVPGRRTLALLAPVLGLVLITSSGPAVATSAQVSVQNFSFTPAIVTVGQGETVTWTFHALHTSTSRQRFWDSGHRLAGTYTVTFRDAGTFGYYCMMHPTMTGQVRVPLKASGSTARGWTLRWSSRASTPGNRRFDVQVQRVGTSTWKAFRTATAARTGLFNPTRSASYRVRARTKNVGVGSSGWSPVLLVKIT